MKVEFTVFAKPQPQGSSRAFVIGGKARITSANKNLKPYREEVSRQASAAMDASGLESFCEHEPLALTLIFTHLKPKSAPKSRRQMVVKPDLDKLIRATCDALTGCVWHDDAQVVEIIARKHYGTAEGVHVCVEPFGA